MSNQETCDPEKMCPNCRRWYDDQHAGPVILDFLIVCAHNQENKLPLAAREMNNKPDDSGDQ